MGSQKNGVFFQNVSSLIHSVSIYLLLPLLNFIAKYISRLQNSGNSSKKNDDDVIFLEAESKTEKNVSEFRKFDSGAKEEEKSELHFKFKFPTFEEFSKLQIGTGNSFNSEVAPSACTSKYEFAAGKSSLSIFLEELRIFPVKEINCDKICNLSEDEEVFPDSVIMGFSGEESGNTEELEFAENKENSVQEEDEEEFLDESEFFSEKNSDDGFLSDGDFGQELDINDENERIGSDCEQSSAFAKSDSMEDIKKFEEHNSIQNLEKSNSEFMSEKDFNENSDKKNDVEFVQKDFGDANKLESLWEHQELIEQLKMELRKVRATGLPTILEESESPKITDDLKPWRIDDQLLQHEDCMGELHKFYKSYAGMMRKFDILNYQKMYAMGFLQLKDPFQSTPHQKPSPPSLKSLVSQNLWLFKHKTNGSDPIKRLINELQGDLEVVYVGQMCLSWEFLHWQYEKTLDLFNSDSNGIHRYNEVAGEFQQFQVLIQRFTEDEPFQGPRIQSYVKSRCVLRNLLQVPAIREDYLNDKTRARKKDRDEYVITSEMLVEIVEESIRIFWRLVRSDKDCNVVAISGYKKMPELQNPEDFKLLVHVRKILNKKERKLKDILRSENCILRKFRQSREDDSDQVLQFFAQVDMKLVSRVLNMSKITRDQLIWCQNKLSRINFVNRKIYVEPAFLLFPC